MPKSIHRSSFQSSLQPIPESDQAHHSQGQSHELQDLSKPTKPAPTRQRSNPNTNEGEGVGEGEEDGRHAFNPNAEAGDRDNLTLPGGKKVGFGIVRWWRDNIARVLPVADDVRDHFALERTFLAYIRTSNALASLSIAIYQLSRLSSPSKSSQPSSPKVLTFEKVITITMITCALLLTVIGCGRFLMLQKKVEHGRWKIGGFEIWGVGWGFIVVEVLLFVAVLLN